jgi:hypothetical protein
MPPSDRHDANRRHQRPPAGGADDPGTPLDRPDHPAASGRGRDSHDDLSVPSVPSALPIPSADQTSRLDNLLGVAPGLALGVGPAPDHVSEQHEEGSHFPRELLIPCRIPSEIFIEVVAAADFALSKHGPPTTYPTRAIAIMTEELGEAAECALKATSLDPEEHRDAHTGHILLMREELLQLAGYALLQVVNIDRGRVMELASVANAGKALGIRPGKSKQNKDGK